MSQKMEQDFSGETQTAIDSARNLAKAGKLSEAIESLLALEKQTRMAEDVASTSKLAVEVVKLCAEQGDWNALNHYVHIISKKRSQLKQAVTNMVKEAVTYVDKTPSKQVKLQLIDALRSVTEGKIYVEVERAHLTRILAKIKEDEGNIVAAADLLQEVQVETIGSMDKRDKIDFILEQVRLVLDKKDYVRANIISKKITKKAIDDPECQDLKIRFYNLMIRYYNNSDAYLDICKSYQAIFNTPIVQEDSKSWIEALQNLIIFLVLSPFDNEQFDFMNRINLEKKLEDIPVFKDILKRFIETELIHWPEFETKYGDLKAHPVFHDIEKGLSRWTDLHNRIVEHNIRVIAKYYSRIQINRFAQLLYLNEQQTEEFVSKMVTSKTIYAKIDRISGVVSFTRPQHNHEILNDWSQNISDLLGLVDKVNHLINKENMIHKIRT